MDTAELLHLRLRAQLIDGSVATTTHDVVSHLLAMQAQDYAGATWAIGLRLPGSSLEDIERALVDGTIVRTWPMRGTLHFVAAEDVRWMLPLLTPRILARAATRERQLELDTATFARATDLLTAALVGGRRLSRPEAMALLDADGIVTSQQRGYHILWRLAQEGLLVLGPIDRKQQTFALLDESVAAEVNALGALVSREEALAHLAGRYFAGHGPATVDDLARWAAIPKSEATAAHDDIKDTLESGEHDVTRYWFAPAVAEAVLRAHAEPPGVHLLPGFDEYMLGYTGRSHQLGEHLEMYGTRVASNGMLAPTVLADGAAVGIWKRALKARTVQFNVTEFQPFTSDERAGVAAEQARYARFVGRSIEVPGSRAEA